jgi:hypothetical protein
VSTSQSYCRKRKEKYTLNYRNEEAMVTVERDVESGT